MREMCKIEKYNGITQKSDACFKPSNFKIRETIFFSQILGLFRTIRAKKYEWNYYPIIFENNQISRLMSLDSSQK